LSQSQSIISLSRRSDEPWTCLSSLQNEALNSWSSQFSLNNTSSSPQASRVTPERKKARPLRPSRKTERDLSDLTWKNTTVQSGFLRQLGTPTARRKTGPPPGRRRGPLGKENARHALIIRRLGACYRCQIGKQVVRAGIDRTDPSD
jgi:hypothetical protein